MMAHTGGNDHSAAAVTVQAGRQSEPIQFISRCLSDIQQSPDSMGAGLSSVLLGSICTISTRMEATIAKQVFNRIVNEVSTNSIPLMRQVAYMTVLSSLLEKSLKASGGKSDQAFIRLTLGDDEVRETLQGILSENLQIAQTDQEMSPQKSWDDCAVGSAELILVEKTVGLFCIAQDVGSFPREFEASVIAKLAMAMLQWMEQRDDTRFKISFGALVRESQRNPATVSDCFKAMSLEKRELTALYESGILCTVHDVQQSLATAFSIDDSQQEPHDFVSYLKPIVYVKPSNEADKLILDSIGRIQKYAHLKWFLAKIQSAQIASCAKQLQNRADYVRCLIFLVKHKGQLEGIFEQALASGKLTLFLVLRSADKNELQQENWSNFIAASSRLNCLEQLLNLCKALTLVNDARGFQLLKQIIENQAPTLSDHFQILCKPLNATVTVQNGFRAVNRLYNQKLHAFLTPILQQVNSEELRTQLTIQSLGLVNLTQKKCEELIPIATAAFTADASQQVKRTSVVMLRKVMANASVESAQKSQLLSKFLPRIIENILLRESEMQLLIEALLALQEITGTLAGDAARPKHVLEFESRVIAACTPLKCHKKRIVRKFARTVIHEWSML